ncbi:hypothetical protein [Deinococcus navajonensis]|uniref:Tetratricopeptide repeat protein n=1 Tax=Deinococcus navajonensis TaxID=309884 RepID=A0ABV8XP80_9DEIO
MNRREDLVQRLSRRLGALSPSRGGLALALWGDPGMGKSWVAGQVLRSLPLRSAEVPATASLPALLRSLPRPARLPTWTEEALRRLGQGEEALGPEATADALNSLLSALAPFALHVSDLHSAPAEQQALWQAVAAGATRGRGVGVLITTRQPPPAPFEVQALSALGEEETARLLAQTLGATPPGDAVHWIGQHARGNPLFSVEYLRFLIRQGCLWNDGQRWHWRPPREKRIPTSVEALISHLCHTPALSPRAHAALRTRALLPGVPVAVWAQVTGCSVPELQQASEELERRGILRGGEFVHPLYREVEAQHLPSDVRRAVARRAVEALLEHDVEAAAAFVEDARLVPGEALPLLRRAASTARAEGRPRHAAEFLSTAARHATGPEQTELALDAARLWRDHEPRRVIPLAEQVLETGPQHLEATLLLAGALALQGEEERAGRLLRSLQGADPGAAWLFGLLALHADRNDYLGVLDLWQAHPQLHGLAPAQTLAQVVRALDFSGQSAEAVALATRTLRKASLSSAERSALLFARCRAQYNAGEVTAAEADATAMVTLAQDEQRLHELARGLSTRATIRDTLGHYPEALADAKAALTIFGQLGVARDYAQQQSRLACLLLEYGDYEQAEALLHEGHDVMKRAGVSHFLALCEYNLAYLYLEQHPPFGGALALKYAHAGLQHARQAGSPLIIAQTAAMAARAEAVHGSPEQALALGDEALALTRQLGNSHDAAWAIWARGFALEALGRTDEAQAAFEEAAHELAGRGLTLWAHRLGLEADRLAGNSGAARLKLAFFHQHQLHNWINVTGRYFPELAGDEPPIPTAEAPVQLGVLGPIRLQRGGQVLRYRGQKGKELLAYLLEARLAGQPEVRQLELQEVLYAELPDAAAASALQQLIYRLRQVLGAEVIQRTDTGYRLGEVGSDAEAFLTTGDPRLWRGPYLVDLGAGWDVAAEEALYHALNRCAQALLGREPREAARLGRILLDRDPYDQGALSLSLRALQASGNRKGVQKLYHDSLQRLREVGETPAPLSELLGD